MTDTDRSFATALRPGAGWGWILAYGVLSALDHKKGASAFSM